MDGEKNHYSLKWNDFSADFTGGFQCLLQEEAMVDVTLAVEDKLICAHKLVLSVCSPYFFNIFKANPCKHPVVILKDVRHDIFSYMLDFMYKGEVSVNPEDLPAFLSLAEGLKIKGLPGKTTQNTFLLRGECDIGKNSTTSKLRRTRISQPISDSDADGPSQNIVLRNRRPVKRRSQSSKNVPREKICVVDERIAVVGMERSLDLTDENEDSDCSPLVKLIIGKTEQQQPQPVHEPATASVTSPVVDVPSTFEGETFPMDDGADESNSSDFNNDDGFDSSTTIYQSRARNRTQDSQEPQGGLKKARQSILWRWFDICESSKIGYCKVCGPLSKPFRFYNTGQLSRHLKSRHLAEYKDFLEAKDSNSQLLLDSFATNFKLSPAKFS